MGIKRMPLHARLRGNHAEGCRCRSDARVQINGRIHNPLAGCRFLFGTPGFCVGPAHGNFDAQPCTLILTASVYFDTHICILKIQPCPRPIINPTSKASRNMETRVTEIADGIFRLSTWVGEIAPPAGFTFNQFLILGDEPLLFHTGLRKLFPLVHGAVTRLMPVDRLRWISFGHVEADECGAMNEWLAAAPRAQVAHGGTACAVSLNDLADRPPRMMANGETIDLGKGKKIRYIDTPHTPHAWESGLIFEETTKTLMCGDLFTQFGNDKELTQGDIVGPAIAAEDAFKSSSLNPESGNIVRGLAALAPRTLALMHGPSFSGNGAAALTALAADYDRRTRR